MNILNNKEYLRSILFGIEDSLVSTTGLIAGISIGSDNSKFILLAGFVAVAIEAVSMGAGEYLSDDAVRELEKLRRYKGNPLLSGTLMLVSYFFAGMIPLSLLLSITFAFLGLFLLGYIKGKILNVSPIKGGIKILLVGGLATILGIFVGFLFRS